MITADQSEIVRFLESPATHGGAAVERVETHASMVFLAGERAWKLKRAVRYDYLDFSTIDRRRAMCEAEVRINRQIAPALYRGVVAVTREPDGSLALGGAGTPVEWLVAMRRFDQDGLFDRLAASGRLGLDLMPALAEAIARFHAGAVRRADHGGAAGMAWVVDGNAAAFAGQAAGLPDASDCAALTRASHEAVARLRPLLDARRTGGFVRQCHGDLHLRNIVLIEGRPTLFDAIEFNDEIACTDVFYDLAFLLMDLWRRWLPRHANAVLNGYLARTADYQGVALLPLFLSCRAAVRAKTSVAAAALHADPQRRRDLRDAAAEYLTLALRLLQPPPACLVAVGGFSGSGKSTIARALAPRIGAVPGAVIVRSDEVRKRLCGVDALHRLDAGGYTAEVTTRVYETVAADAGLVLKGGHAAIADAVHASAVQREAIERAAAAARVPFIGLWLDAPETTLVARGAHRRADASDADADVIRRQLDRGAGPMTWSRIDASGTPEQVLDAATAVLRQHVRNRGAGSSAAAAGDPGERRASDSRRS